MNHNKVKRKSDDTTSVFFNCKTDSVKICNDKKERGVYKLSRTNDWSRYDEGDKIVPVNGTKDSREFHIVKELLDGSKVIQIFNEKDFIYATKYAFKKTHKNAYGSEADRVELAIDNDLDTIIKENCKVGTYVNLLIQMSEDRINE